MLPAAGHSEQPVPLGQQHPRDDLAGGGRGGRQGDRPRDARAPRVRGAGGVTAARRSSLLRPGTPVDLLLSDVVMPGMSGVEPPTGSGDDSPVRVLYMSGSPDVEVVDDMEANGSTRLPAKLCHAVHDPRVCSRGAGCALAARRIAAVILLPWGLREIERDAATDALRSAYVRGYLSHQELASVDQALSARSTRELSTSVQACPATHG